MKSLSSLAVDIDIHDAVLAAAVLTRGIGVAAFASALSALAGRHPAVSTDSADTRPHRPHDVEEPLPSSKEARRSRTAMLHHAREGDEPPVGRHRLADERQPNLLDVSLQRNRAFRGDGVQWRTDGQKVAPRPIHFPLIASNTFAAVLGALGRQPEETDALDVVRLVDAIATRRPLRGLPAKTRLGLGSKVVIIRDLGLGMIPFQPDIEDFVRRTRRLLGRDKVRDDVYIESEGTIAGIDTIGTNSTVIALSDLQGFGRRYGYGHSKRSHWLALARRIQATGSRMLVLSPGTPAGDVPMPAFPDLFDGRRPRVAPIVPWDTSLSARVASTYARRERVAIHRPPAHNIADGGSSAYLLLRLLTLVQDVDQWTLRTLRLVLSAPHTIVQAYGAEIDNRNEMKRWRADVALQPPDRGAGAFHEHSVWTSAYLAHRAEIATLSGKMDELRTTLPANIAANWDAVVHFAREALVRSRAGRGLTQLVGDGRRWAVSLDRRDREVADREIEESQWLAEEIARLDGSPRRLWQIDRTLMAASVVTAAHQGTLPHLTLLRQRETLRIGLDLPQADLSIELQEGYDLQSGRVELWPVKDADSPAIERPLWPLPQILDLQRDDKEPLRTVVVRLGAQIAFLNLDATLSEMKPLFARNMPSATSERPSAKTRSAFGSKTLRFEGQDIHYLGRRYDRIGLRDLGESTPISERDADLPQGCTDVSSGPLGIWLKDGNALYAQRFARSAEVSALDLPRPDQRLSASGQDGHVIAANGRRTWLVTSEAASATVVQWENSPGWPDRATASAVGGLLAIQSSNAPNVRSAQLKWQTRLYFFPASNRPSYPSVVTALLPGSPTEIAMSDSGLIAIRQGSELKVYESLEGLGEAQSDIGADMNAASAGEKRPTFNARVRGPYRRTWLPAKDYDLSSTLEALVSEDIDALTRLARAFEHNVRVPAREVEEATKVAPAQAQLISNIFAGDGAAVAMADTGSVNFHVPGSGLSPLQLACLRKLPGDVVPALLKLGADPNAPDRFGRTPLYSASFANDNGLTLTTLLDAGADPSRSGMINGEPVGPLAPALWSGDASAPLNVIERLIEGGANPLAFGGRELWSALINAAGRNDSALFRRILMVDSRVNYMGTDGWSPLRVAAWTGQVEIMEILLSRGARADIVAEDGLTPLIDAARRGHAHAAALLLRHGADVNGARAQNGIRLSPLEYAIHQSAEEVTPESIAGVARVLAAAGANSDVEPFPFRRVLHPGSLGSKTELAMRAFAEAGHPPALLETIRSFPIRQLNGDQLHRLLDLPTDLTARDAVGVRLVHLLAMLWSPKKDAASINPFQLLVERGVSLEACDDNGSSPLHYAAAKGNAEAVRSLLQLAPGLTALRRTDGTSAADLAQLFGHQSLFADLGGVTATNDAASTQPAPLAATMARLTLLPLDTSWRIEAPTPMRRAAGVTVEGGAALPPVIPTWTAVLTREASLPYKSGRTLRETWWRRTDDIVGLSATVLDAANATIFDIDGTSPPIHAMNASEPPRLETATDAFQYLKFFCQAVHGEEGQFAVCDTKQVLLLHAGAALVDAGAAPAHTLQLSKADTEGDWKASVTMRYSNGIFAADLNISSSGMVDMTSDRPLLELPKPERFDNDQRKIFFYTTA